MYLEFNPLDLIDSGETFDPQSWEHWGLIVLFVAFAIGGYIWVNNQSKRPKNYRYSHIKPDVLSIITEGFEY